MNDPRKGCTSASSAEADSLCPGRFLAQKGLPEFKSKEAEAGTRIHAALATGTREGLSGEESDIADACSEVEKKLVDQYFGPGAKIRSWREQRYWCKVRQGQNVFDHSGQVDFIGRDIRKALVIDYKTGPADQPESPRNAQLRDLAVLVAGNLVIPEVAVAIVQPLATMTPEICIYTQDDIKRAEQEMFTRVANSRNPEAKRVAGEKQCRYCRATGTCAEYQAWAGARLPAPQSILGVPIASWTPQQCAVFCSGRAIAQKWLDDAESAMKARLKADPDAIPGWCLKEGKTRSTVTDPEELFRRFSTLGGTQSAFLKFIKILKEGLEDQLRVLTKTKGKALSAEVDKILQGIVETKQDQPSLAKRKDV